MPTCATPVSTLPDRIGCNLQRHRISRLHGFTEHGGLGNADGTATVKPYTRLDTYAHCDPLHHHTVSYTSLGNPVNLRVGEAIPRRPIAPSVRGPGGVSRDIGPHTEKRPARTCGPGSHVIKRGCTRASNSKPREAGLLLKSYCCVNPRGGSVWRTPSSGPERESGERGAGRV